MDAAWEELVTLNSFKNLDFEILDKPKAYWKGLEAHPNWVAEFSPGIEQAVVLDTAVLPVTKDREGYYGSDHISYWASGYRDMVHLLEVASKYRVPVQTYLDFGAASGRTVRHFAANRKDIQVFACDINRRHIDWMNGYLPESIIAFQNHSIPNLPIPDASVDLVSAYSVFTHIEAFETSWLMELRRILRPGGLAWVTVHTERTWVDMKEGWPLYRALKNHPDFDPNIPRSILPEERLVFRWRKDRSYSSNVFYRTKYIERVWGRYFDIVDFRHRFPSFQDVVVLQKAR